VASSYGRHWGTQHAAAIAYRVLFSLVPFVALVVSIVDLVLPASRRERFLEWLFAEFPGADLEQSVDRALAESSAAAPVVGLVSLALLLWGATGMMAALRHAFTAIWDLERPRGYFRGKLRDVALVGLAGAFLIAAFALSVTAQLVAETGTDVAAALGWESGGGALSAIGELASVLLALTGALVVVYSFVPPTPVQFAHVWPSALAAAVVFQIATAGFAVYAARFADFNTAYGSLGTVFAFLLLVYVLAIVLLVGAETVAARSRAAGKADGSAGV
jgi:membrane protein